VKAVWCLKSISNQSNLEALMSSSGCIVEAGEGSNKTRLRFYLESTDVTVPGQQQQPHLEKYLSLCCQTLDGNQNQQASFAVKVDRLMESSFQFQKNILAERAVVIKSEEDRQGKLIEKLFLLYITAPLLPNGQPHRETYCFASNKDLCFGITVTPLQSIGSGGGALSGSVDEALGQDLRKMLVDEKNFSDVVLETKDGMDIHAHKFILAGKHDVFNFQKINGMT